MCPWVVAVEEEENKKLVRRSIVARVNIPKGATITEEILDIKRPGTGVEPKYMNLLLGKTAKEDIRQEEIITLSKVM